MGYFSNGEEGRMYEEQWCRRCLHEDDQHGCSVWAVHFTHNYDQSKNPALAAVLTELIPRSADGLSNLRCTMFKSKNTPRGPRLRPGQQAALLDLPRPAPAAR